MHNDELPAQLENRSILVTGGAGFIGSNIVRYLATQTNAHVRVLDNLVTGKISNIDDLVRSGRASFLEGDIRDAEACKAACLGIDTVLHQAALGSVQRSMIDPASTNAVNVGGFVNMLAAAKDQNVQRFVYASSSSVYGDDQHMPKLEEQTGRLLSPYAVSKKTNELYAGVFAGMSAMRIVGLRYFNIFGPRQDVNGPYAAVIPLFIEAMIAGKQATIFGDGENSRDFTYVDNAVQANIRAALSPLPENESPVLNIAFGGTTSLNTLHRLLAEIIGHQQPALHAPVRKGDIRDSFADISKATNLLGYTPAVGLEEGLRKTVEWFLSRR